MLTHTQGVFFKDKKNYTPLLINGERKYDEYLFDYLIGCHDKNHIHGKKLKNLLTYNMIDVSHKVNQLINYLIDVKNITDNKMTNDEYLLLILKWYAKIPTSEKFLPMTDEEYLSKKSCIIASHIFDALKGKKPPYHLLDIGFGDAQLTLRVPQHLAKMYQEKIGKKISITTSGLDLGNEDTAEKWKGSGGVVKEGVNLYFYDGKEMIKALDDKGIKSGSLDVVMINHALHHWPTFDSQVEAIKNINKLLKIGGVLFLTEHDNVLSNQIFHVQHMLFDLINIVNEMPRDDNGEIDLSSLSESISSYTVRKGEDEKYFSRYMLKMLLHHQGFLLLSDKNKVDYYQDILKVDPSKTVFYTAVKQAELKDVLINEQIRSFSI